MPNYLMVLNSLIFISLLNSVEILITAGGENIAPVPIEDRIKEQLPCVSNCMLLGDRLKFLTVLLTLKVSARAHTHIDIDTVSMFYT